MIGPQLRTLLVCACFFVAAGVRAADAPADPVAAAIGSSERPAGDSSQDAWRQPAVILAFLGVKLGWHVAVLRGATTPSCCRIGPTGEVIAHNTAYAGFSAMRRRALRRQPTLQRPAAHRRGGCATPSRGARRRDFRDALSRLYCPEDGSWPKTDPKLMLCCTRRLATRRRVVQDHVATPGGDPSAIVEKLHRIDPAVVRRDFEAAGFKVDAESAALKHEADDHTKLVFDPAIKGKTDQIIYRFRKIAR
jgi:predicted methyltransferase